MMIDTPTSTVPSEISAESRSWPMRLWLAAPDWLFRVLGLAFFTVFTWVSAEKYWSGDFWNYVPWSELPSGKVIRMPWVPVLIDLTYLLIAISFIVRFQPKSRAADGRIILITLFTAFAPFIFVMWLGWGLGLFNESWKAAYYDFLWRSPITWYTALVGGVLITVGNILDVWGYLVLCRSFGIVPEARELKTTGPYRFVRHPVYLGQFIAQAGVWLCFARLHIVWISLYCAFVALQLYRSKLEDRVLEQAIGDDYREWKRRTFWFV